MKASELALLVGGQLSGPDRSFTGVAPLGRAGEQQATYSVRPPPWDTQAGVVIGPAAAPDRCTVVVEDPRLAFSSLLYNLFPQPHPPGVQPGAHVHPTANLGPGVSVYPGAYVGPDVEIGEDAVIMPGAVILEGSKVGRGCLVGPGAVVGHAGFGVHPGPGGPIAVPQVGRAVLEEGVHLGANTCVDRAFLEETRVGRGSHLDNPVQVGHNCTLGPGVIMAAQGGLSGSVEVGAGSVLGGQAGVADHVRLAPGTRLGGQAGANKDLPGGAWMGTPAVPITLAGRIFATWKLLPGLLKRLRTVEERLRRLEQRLDRKPGP